MSWSLRRRTSLAFSATATVYLILCGVGVVISYRMILARELDEELVEQQIELRSRFLSGPRSAADFERLCASSGIEESETPAAWIVRDASGEALWGPFGPARLAAQFSTPQAQEDGTTRPESRLRRRVTALDEEHDLDTVLDGQEWLDRVVLFERVMIGIAAVGSLLSLFAGRFFGGRVASWLEQIAEELSDQEARSGGSKIQIPGAPTEIREVVESVEDTLRKTREETDRARLLTAGLAHDLRAPLQTLLSSTQVALLQPEEVTSTASLLAGHLSELRTLSRTVDNLVSYGSPRSLLTDETTRIQFDFGEELRARLAGEEAEAARRGILVDLESKGELTLLGHPSELILAVRNLVSNAIAWSPENGQVEIRLDGTQDALTLSVDDQGPGVPEKERARIFEPFVRGAAAPGRRAGYGLGLAIVGDVARRHGGEVSVTDSALGGARFKLCLQRSHGSSGRAS